MALFYIYTFQRGDREIHLYAADEKDAREQYLELYGVEAGELLRRTRW